MVDFILVDLNFKLSTYILGEISMSYVALYRKYRPKNFEEIVGQKAIVTTLKNQLSSGKIGHAYLFCGMRGTGKTTLPVFTRPELRKGSAKIHAINVMQGY